VVGLYRLNPVTHSLKLPYIQIYANGFSTLLSLSSENPVSKFAFKWVNLYRYVAGADRGVEGEHRAGLHADLAGGAVQVESS
jgi:hypothetical protein